MTNSARTGFAARFQQALAEAGYGDVQLRELGTLFGVTGEAVRKWLTEEAIPRSSRAGNVAAKLGVRRAWLLDGETPMRAVNLGVEERGQGYAGKDEALSLSKEEYKMLTLYRGLPRNVQVSINAMLESVSREMLGKRKRQKN